MSEIKPWREYIGKHDAYMIMCDVLDVLCEKEAIKKTVYERLKQAPSADRPSGEWIIRDNPGTGWYRVTCSECGEDFTSVIQVIGFFPDAKVIWDYCPNCGAKMVGEDGEA